MVFQYKVKTSNWGSHVNVNNLIYKKAVRLFEVSVYKVAHYNRKWGPVRGGAEVGGVKEGERGSK